MGFIRWIADVTGVTKEIKEETTKQIGYYMNDYSYWFTGGLMYGNNTKYDIANTLSKYSEILRDGRTNLVGSGHEKLRSELYELSEKGECVHK